MIQVLVELVLDLAVDVAEELDVRHAGGEAVLDKAVEEEEASRLGRSQSNVDATRRIRDRDSSMGDTKLVTGPGVSSATPHLRVAEY